MLLAARRAEKKARSRRGGCVSFSGLAIIPIERLLAAFAGIVNIVLQNIFVFQEFFGLEETCNLRLGSLQRIGAVDEISLYTHRKFAANSARSSLTSLGHATELADSTHSIGTL